MSHFFLVINHSTVHFDMGKKELMEYYSGGIDFK